MNIEICKNVETARRRYDGSFTLIEYSDYQSLVSNLESVFDNECLCIESCSIASGLTPHEYGGILSLLVRKLRHGGTIGIEGVETFSLCEQLLAGTIGVIEFNNKIFGPNGDNRGVNTLLDTSSLMKELGLVIDVARLDQNEKLFVVVGRRP